MRYAAMPNAICRPSCRVYQAAGRDCPLFMFDSLPSTNAFIRENAHQLPSFAAVLAKTQTAGRGRLGRSFYSPPGSGLYMSVLIRDLPASACLRATPAAATAVCLLLEEETGRDFQIKWVNDVYLDGRKVCGILCEKIPEGMICGIGINLAEPDDGFPGEIRDTAGAAGCRADAAELACRLPDLLAKMLTHPETAFSEYEKRMFLAGRHVLYRGESALVLGLESDYSLRVRYADGTEEALRAGGVTLHEALSGPQSGR